MDYLIEDDNLCAICRDDEFQCDFVTRCGHFYHQECIKLAWFEKGQRTCPYCKNSISTSKEMEALLRLNQEDMKLHCLISPKTISELKSALEKRPDLFKDPQRYHSAFQVALRNNRKFMIKFLTSLSPFVNFRDKKGRTVLMITCWIGTLDTVKRLVESGADIDARDATGNSVLVAACKSRKLDIFEYLVKEGADIYSKNLDGLTVLHWACSFGYLEVVQFILKNVFDFSKLEPTKIGLIEAAYIGGNVQILELLVKSDSNLNELNLNGQSALFRVPGLDESIDFIKSLLSLGIDCKIVDKWGRNALCNYIINCNHGATTIVKLMLEAGLDVNLPDSLGMTSVHYACLNDKNLEIMELFYNFEARFDVKNSRGQYPYDLVQKRNPFGKIEKFMQHYGLTFSKDSVVSDLSGTITCEKCKKHHIGKDCPNTMKIKNPGDIRIKRIY